LLTLEFLGWIGLLFACLFSTDFISLAVFLELILVIELHERYG